MCVRRLRFYRLNVVLVLYALVLPSCAETPVQPALDDAPNAPRSIVIAPTVDAVTEIARVFAAALERPSVRQYVLEDLRDSPFARRRIHLASYLRGARAAAMMREGAKAIGITPDSLMSILTLLPEMELQMPRPYDRASWTADQGVAVSGVSRTLSDIYAAKGAAARVMVYAPGRRTLSVGLDDQFHVPLLMIKPAEIDYGVDPEATRRAAPRRTGTTITTREEEFTTMETCDPETAVVECPEEGGGTVTNHGGYFLTHSYNDCVNAQGYADSDADGLRDSCEYEIAQAFRPGLRFDLGERWGTRDPYWSVRRSNYYPNALSVFYAIGYHRDNGDVIFGLESHDGDSEFLVIAVSDITGGGGGRWALETVTYSAHWHSFWDRTDEQRYYETVFWSDGTYRGRPRSYVAESKHANYRSQSVCNSRGDNCDPSSGDLPVEVRVERNLGNMWATGAPLFTNPCSGTLYATQPYTECFWTDDTFRGWRTENGSGGGGYKYPLEWYGF